MRAAIVLHAAAAAASAPACPAPNAIADVYLGLPFPGHPIHFASDAHGNVTPAPWTWMPSEAAVLQPFAAEEKTLRCGHYYGWDCRRIEGGTTVTINCHSEVCDAYVFLYHEPPRSSNVNGQLPLTLPDAGWRPSSCAPTFCVTPGAGQVGSETDTGTTASPSGQTQCCRMTAFRRQLHSGTSSGFTVGEAGGAMPVYYMLLAVAPGAVCDSNVRQADQATCEEVPQFGNAWCHWVTGNSTGQDQNAQDRDAQPLSNHTGEGRCEDAYCPAPTTVGPRGVPSLCEAPLSEPSCSALPWR
eukprot:TRINITY_DN4636_c0_g1_i1.p1 TRINITY_DN4636_c0_g1~~TRINITY_DN4636_c0_g1_i1.p1  ORF type:complete len:322 (+),score=39.44 TRINITY_DN4636_c0_g1_i1:71-967(+)